jgi:hypothetical protein
VLGEAELARLSEGSQPTPAIHVFLDDVRVNDTAKLGTLYTLDQFWLISVAVRNVRSTEALLQEAGELATRVLSVVAGWQPTRDYSPLEINTPLQLRMRGQIGYLYTRFRTDVIWRVPTTGV